MNKITKKAEDIVRDLRSFCRKIVIAGSIRRKDPSPNDIDIVCIPRDVNAIRYYFKRKGMVSGGEKQLKAEIDNISIDVWFTDERSWGAALLHRTGPAGAAIWNRQLARQKGYKLNQYGLFNLKTGRQLLTPTEFHIYKALGKPYRRPEDRGKPR